MQQFLIKANRFLNKLFLISIFIFIGYCLAGCSPRQHLQPDLSDSVPSNARYEYEAMQKFKANNKAFYKQLISNNNIYYKKSNLN